MLGNWLLCDFHIHTNLSDGKLPLCEVVDHYGKKGFDAISITDHIIDDYTLKERRAAKTPIYAVKEKDFIKYLNLLWDERRRAWEKYNMLLIPGVELTNNWKKYHILAIDIKKYIDPTKSVKKIVDEIQKQGAISIACHPHHKDTEGEQEFIHLWNNHKKYENIFDAWEVANRDDLFNAIGLKKFNYIANSDFHELRHLYSWKTLIKCEKNVEAIKEAIRENKNIAIYLLRKTDIG